MFGLYYGLNDLLINHLFLFFGFAEATPKTIMRVMGVKGLTLYHLKSHLQVWLIQNYLYFIHAFDFDFALCFRSTFMTLPMSLVLAWCLSFFLFFLYLYFIFYFFHLLSAFRNLGLASSPTRNSMITRLRMVWEVTLLSRVPQFFLFFFLLALNFSDLYTSW